MKDSGRDRDPLDEIYSRPGFMLRRAHQMAVSVFLEECGRYDITPTQYAILFILSHHPGVPQIDVARLLGLDRSTTGLVVSILEQRGLIRRSVDPADRRRRSISLTRKGGRLIARAHEASDHSQQRLMSVFTSEERDAFLSLLRRFTDAFNQTARTPISRDVILVRAEKSARKRRRS